MAINPNLVSATAGQRLAAMAVDTVPLLVLLAAVLSVPGTLALIVGSAAAGAYLLWLWLWESGSGQTPGNRLTGLRTVSQDGLAPGFPAVMVRGLLLLVSAVTVVGPWILAVSSLWDHPNRRQGWHDKAARTLTVDIRAGRNPLATGGRWAHSGSGSHGQRIPPADSPGVPAFSSRISSSVPAAGAPGGWVPRGEAARTVAAAEPVAGPISRVPGPAHPSPAVPSPAAQTAAGSQNGAQRNDAAPQPKRPAVTPQTAAPAARLDLEDENDVELTRVVSRPGGTGCRLVFDDGTAVRVTGTALLGRNPAAAIGEKADQLIDFADMGRSVSKTHLHLQADGGSGLWVTDRNSTNGSSVVAPDGRHVALTAHSPVLAPAGSTVYFGDRHFTVG